MAITAVLNGFRRPDYLSEQFQAIQNQKVSTPVEFLYWQNGLADFPSLPCPSAISNHNFGVWARFAYALNAKTEYVCIFDDDTIPGSLWFQNCLDTYKTHPGILGTIGVRFTRPEYRYFQRVG